MARTRRAVTLRNQKFLEGHEPSIREENAHPRGGRGGNALPNKEHTNQRADRDTNDKKARCPDKQLPQKRRQADVMDIHKHHRDQGDVIGGGKRDQHQDFCREPVAALDRSGEDAFDETIRADSRGTRPRAE